MFENTATLKVVGGPLLTVNNLNIDILSQTGSHRVVHGASFEMQPGDILGIVGESGSGKSLTANAVMGILPDVAVAQGEITYKGVDLLALTPKQREAASAKEIGYIFQEPMSALHPTMTIAEQMVRPLRKHLKLTKKQALDRARELLNLVGIPPERGVLGSYVHQLSGGMRQRVMIAMSISCDPQLLIADEPTTALDATIQKQILDLLVKLQEELHLSMLLISHDLGLISKYAQEVVVMLDGYVMEQGKTKDLITNPQSAYTRDLLQAAPRLGQHLERLPVMDRSQYSKAVAK